VFGHYLARTGAQIAYLVRPAYRAQVERGFDLARLRIGRSAQRERYQGFGTLSSLEEVAGHAPDHVLLTMSSAALRGPWLTPFLAQVPPAASVISLQPDASDHALLRSSGASAEQLVCGSIGFVAFSGPLPGQRGVEVAGTHYWFPPFSRSGFSGAGERARAFVALLRRSQFPAAIRADVARAMAFPNAVGMTYLSALEASGWSLASLRRGALLGVCERGVREALALVEHEHGARPLGFGLLAQGWLAALGFAVAARVTPFPLLAFVTQHFSKVSAQTQLIVARLVAEGERAGLAHGALAELLTVAARASARKQE
jgi:ketopantoate reductase